MKIAGHPVLSNAAFRPHLPPSWRTLLHLAKAPPEVIEAKIEDGTITPELDQGGAFKLYREWKEDQAPAIVPDPEGPTELAADIRWGDFREVLSDLEPESVDLILTDPPYSRDDLDLYEALGDLAKHLLSPNGVLLTYAGTMFLPDVIGRLSRHLQYGWTFCLLMDADSHSRIDSRHLLQRWKPILAFTPDGWTARGWQPDVVVNPKREKGLYEWQQGLAPVAELVTGFTSPGELVVDPFTGTGTTAIAALTQGRHFIGAESDRARQRLAQRRVAEALV